MCFDDTVYLNKSKIEKQISMDKYSGARFVPVPVGVDVIKAAVDKYSASPRFFVYYFFFDFICVCLSLSLLLNV
jgi:hypothetical protein